MKTCIVKRRHNSSSDSSSPDESVVWSFTRPLCNDVTSAAAGAHLPVTSTPCLKNRPQFQLSQTFLSPVSKLPPQQSFKVPHAKKTAVSRGETFDNLLKTHVQNDQSIQLVVKRKDGAHKFDDVESTRCYAGGNIRPKHGLLQDSEMEMEQSCIPPRKTGSRNVGKNNLLGETKAAPENSAPLRPTNPATVEQGIALCPGQPDVIRRAEPAERRQSKQKENRQERKLQKSPSKLNKQVARSSVKKVATVNSNRSKHESRDERSKSRLGEEDFRKSAEAVLSGQMENDITEKDQPGSTSDDESHCACGSENFTENSEVGTHGKPSNSFQKAPVTENDRSRGTSVSRSKAESTPASKNAHSTEPLVPSLLREQNKPDCSLNENGASKTGHEQHSKEKSCAASPVLARYRDWTTRRLSKRTVSDIRESSSLADAAPSWGGTASGKDRPCSDQPQRKLKRASLKVTGTEEEASQKQAPVKDHRGEEDCGEKSVASERAVISDIEVNKSDKEVEKAGISDADEENNVASHPMAASFRNHKRDKVNGNRRPYVVSSDSDVSSVSRSGPLKKKKRQKIPLRKAEFHGVSDPGRPKSKKDDVHKDNIDKKQPRTSTKQLRLAGRPRSKRRQEDAVPEDESGNRQNIPTEEQQCPERRPKRQCRPPGAYWLKGQMNSIESAWLPVREEVWDVSKSEDHDFTGDESDDFMQAGAKTRPSKSTKHSLDSKPDPVKQAVFAGNAKQSVSSKKSLLPVVGKKSNARRHVEGDLPRWSTDHRLVPGEVICCHTDDIILRNKNAGLPSETDKVKMGNLFSLRNVSGNLMVLESGSESGLKVDVLNHHIYVILEGSVVVMKDKEESVMRAGDTCFVPSGSKFNICNKGTSRVKLHTFSIEDRI